MAGLSKFRSAIIDGDMLKKRAVVRGNFSRCLEDVTLPILNTALLWHL